MATCLTCGNGFIPAEDYESNCPECVDMDEARNADACEEFYEDDYNDDVDELQENQDFARDDEFYNRENEVEDQFLDSSWEDRNEMVDYEGDYFGGDF